MSSFAGILVGTHALLALRMNNPDLIITDKDAEDFLKAAQNVARHYSVQTTQKTMDWISFLWIAGAMYGSRAFSVLSSKTSTPAAPVQQRSPAPPVAKAPETNVRTLRPAPMNDVPIQPDMGDGVATMDH